MSKIDWYGNEMFPFRFSQCMPDLGKDTVYIHYFRQLLKDALQIFDIKNLPETFNRRFFKLVLLLKGRIAIFREKSGTLRALNMSTASRPDIYYVPEKVLIVNPTFKGVSYNLKLGEECAVIYCTSMDQYTYGLEQGGLYSLLSITSTLLADNTISINTAQKNLRLHKLLGADDDNTKLSIEAAFDRMYYGRPFQVVQKSLLDQLADVPMQENGSQQIIAQLLQANQYIKAQFYEQIGFITHDQIKKERLISSELTEGAEMAVFNIQDMIENIKAGLKEANNLFGLNMELVINPLIMRTLEPDPADPEEKADDQSGAAAELDPEDQSEAAADPEEEEAGDGEPESEDQSEAAADPEEEEAGDGEPEAEDQSEAAAEPEEEEAGDGEPEAEDQSEAAAEPAEEAADILIEAAAELAEKAAELTEESEEEEALDPLEALQEAAERLRANRGNAN